MLLLGGCFAVVLATWSVPTVAQESGDDAKDPAFSQKFWNYLQEADYQEEWSRWPGQNEEFIEGSSPHGAFLKIYINDTVKNNTEDPPVKSLIVKENYNKDKELVAITPMYRVGNDYDPDHNDWFWAKYLPDGSLDKNPKGMSLAGRVAKGADQGCIACHTGAGEDMLFTTDHLSN